MSSTDFKKGDLVRWKASCKNDFLLYSIFYFGDIDDCTNSIGIYLGEYCKETGRIYFSESNRVLMLSNHSLEKLS